MAKEDLPLEKVTLNIFVGDKETLAKWNPVSGWSVGARNLIHDCCKKLREVDSQEVVGEGPKLEVEIPLELETKDAG